MESKNRRQEAARARPAPRRGYRRVPLDPSLGKSRTSSIAIPDGVRSLLSELAIERGTSVNSEITQAILDRLRAAGKL